MITKCSLVCSMCTADKLSFTFDTEYLFGHLGWVRSGEEPDWSEIVAEIEIDPMSFLVVGVNSLYQQQSPIYFVQNACGQHSTRSR